MTCLMVAERLLRWCNYCGEGDLTVVIYKGMDEHSGTQTLSHKCILAAPNLIP